MTRLLGVDLGHYSIKIAEVESTGRSWDICGLYELPRLPDVDVGLQLKEFFEKSGIKAERISVGLSDNPVFVRTMDFPFQDKRRVQSAVMSELEDVLPFEITDQVVDIQYLGKTDDRKNRFMVGVSPLAPIAKLNKIFEVAEQIPTGYFLPAETLGQLALYQDLGFDQELDKYRLVIDIGYDTTQLAIVNGFRGDPNKAKPKNAIETGVVDFREFPHGLKSVIEWISQSKKIEFQEAAQWLKHRAQIKSSATSTGVSQMSDEISDDIKVAFRPIVVEIYQFLQNFRTRFEKSVSKAFITGGVSRLSGLREFLHEELRIEVFYWSTFTSFNTQKVTLLNEQESTFAVALALTSRYGIRRPTGFLNFRRSDQARRRIVTGAYQKILLPENRKPLSFTLIALAVLFLYSFIGNYIVDKEIKNIQNELSLDFRRIDRDLGKKAEKVSSQYDKLKNLFEKEKKFFEKKSETENKASASDLDMSPKSEVFFLLSSLKLPSGLKLERLNLVDGVEGGKSVVMVDALWIQADLASPLVEESLSAYKQDLQKELTPKGFAFKKLESGIQFGVKMEALVSKEVK